MKQKLRLQNQVISIYNNYETFSFRNLLQFSRLNFEKALFKTINSEKESHKTQILDYFFNDISKNIFNFLILWLFLVLIFQNQLVISDLIFINNLNMYTLNFFSSLTFIISNFFS